MPGEPPCGRDAPAAGSSASNIETLSSYAGEDDLGALFIEGVQQVAQRVCIGDAVRACGADGELAPEELAMIHRIAERLDVPAEVVDEFVDIYQQEQALKARQAALTFPQGVAAAAGA